MRLLRPGMAMHPIGLGQLTRLTSFNFMFSYKPTSNVQEMFCGTSQMKTVIYIP
jgi:hypothetical protein